MWRDYGRARVDPLLKSRGQGSDDCKGGFVTMNFACEGGKITEGVEDGLPAKVRLAVAVSRLDCSLVGAKGLFAVAEIVNHRCRMVGGSC